MLGYLLLASANRHLAEPLDCCLSPNNIYAILFGLFGDRVVPSSRLPAEKEPYAGLRRQESHLSTRAVGSGGRRLRVNFKNWFVHPGRTMVSA